MLDKPAIALLPPDGVVRRYPIIYVAYTRVDLATNGKREIWAMQSRDAGVSWGAPALVSPETIPNTNPPQPSTNQAPQIMVDTATTDVYVLWARVTPSAIHVKRASSTNPLTFPTSNATTLTTGQLFGIENLIVDDLPLGSGNTTVRAATVPSARIDPVQHRHRRHRRRSLALAHHRAVMSS